MPLDVGRDGAGWNRGLVGTRRLLWGLWGIRTRGLGTRFHLDRRVPRRLLHRARADLSTRGGGHGGDGCIRRERVRRRRPSAAGRLGGIDSSRRGRRAARRCELGFEPRDIRLVFPGACLRLHLGLLTLSRGGVLLAERRLGAAKGSHGDGSVLAALDEAQGVCELGVVRRDALELLQRPLHAGRVPLRAGHPAWALGLAGRLEDGVRAVRGVVGLERGICRRCRRVGRVLLPPELAADVPLVIRTAVGRGNARSEWVG